MGDACVAPTGDTIPAMLSRYQRFAILAALLLLTASALAASPLAEAKRSLDAGKLDEVLFTLDGKTLSGAEQLQAAALLAHAARKSIEAKDPLFAIQLSERALRRDPKNPLALETGARAFLHEKQFTPAEKLADRWIAADPAPAARLFRAEIALEEGEWDHALALTEPLAQKHLSPDDRRRRDAVQLKAHAALSEREQGLSRLHSMDLALKVALAQAAELERQGALAPVKKTRGVVIYGTSWCGYCKKARAYLADHHVDFEDKDVEKDPEAARELAQKQAAHHVHYGGVPIIDVRGELVRGFNQKRLAQLLGL